MLPHKLCSSFQTFGCNLVSALSTHTDDVSILYRTFTESPDEYHKRYENDAYKALVCHCAKEDI